MPGDINIPAKTSEAIAQKKEPREGQSSKSILWHDKRTAMYMFACEREEANPSLLSSVN